MLQLISSHFVALSLIAYNGCYTFSHSFKVQSAVGHCLCDTRRGTLYNMLMKRNIGIK